jgi:type IV fimbrial biogenesis protein FimT
MAARLRRGFTLIELMVAMTILILLLVLAVPGYVLWMSDSEIRNATESVASGLRYAQATAISSNRNAQFVLNPTGWNVTMVDAPLVPIQTAAFNEGAKNVTVVGKDTTLAAGTTVAFNALGQTTTDPTNLALVDLSMPAVAKTTPLRVLVGNGRTGVKICDPDPKWVFPDPRACPP